MNKRLTDKQKDEISYLRGELGQSISSIEAKIGISRSSISWYCLMNAIDPPVIKFRNPKRPKIIIRKSGIWRAFTPEEDRVIIDLRKKGHSLKGIGKQLGRRHNSIIGRLAWLGREEERAQNGI